MIIKAACSACTKPMIVEGYEVGQSVNCPYCGNLFVPPPPKGRVAPAVPPPGPPKSGMPIVSAKGPAHAPAPVQAPHPVAPVSARQPPGSGVLQPGSGVLRQGPPPAGGSSTRQPKPAGLSGQHSPVVAVPVVEGHPVGPPPSSRRMKQAGVPVVEGHAVGIPSGKRRRKPTGAGIDGMSGFMFGVVAILMIVLAAMPFMTWLKGTVITKNKSGAVTVTSTYFLQGSGNASTDRVNNISGPLTSSPPPVAVTMRTEAVLLLTLTLVILFLSLVALLCQIYGPANQPWPPQIFGAGLALLAVWSVVGLLWASGDIWKVFSVADEVSRLLKDNVRDTFGPEQRGGEPVASVSVGMGLWLGLVSAFLCTLLLVFIGKRRGKLLWVLIAMGVGVLIGLIVVFAVVQPTKAEGGFIGTPSETVPQKGW